MIEIFYIFLKLLLNYNSLKLLKNKESRYIYIFIYILSIYLLSFNTKLLIRKENNFCFQFFKSHQYPLPKIQFFAGIINKFFSTQFDSNRFMV